MTLSLNQQLWGSLVFLALLAGCAGDSAPPPPRVLSTEIESVAGLNPRDDKSSQAVDILFLQLETPHKLDLLDLPALYPQMDKPSQALGADLVSSQRLRLEPGANQILDMEIDARARYVGIVVAFEQYHLAKWHDLVQLRDDSALDKVLFRNKRLVVVVKELSVSQA